MKSKYFLEDTLTFHHLFAPPQHVNLRDVAKCHKEHNQKKDYFFLTLLAAGIVLYFGHMLSASIDGTPSWFDSLCSYFFDLINTMSWGIALGIIFVGILGVIPREYVFSFLGQPGSKSGIFRAVGAGLLLDLCSHGILLVGMTLYKRGASLGQVMAFLIASPWNSFSLTLILFALVGVKWTLIFIALSAVIALISGFVFDSLEKRGTLPSNPNEAAMKKDFHFLSQLKNDLRNHNFQCSDFTKILRNGASESTMILKWILLGAILSSLIKVFVDTHFLQSYFGPSFLGLLTTLGATTLLEVCSEGSTPIAADLLQRAESPGSAFTFLMAGVATDYTEILSLKSTTRSLKIALFLPLITVPQVLLIGYLLNAYLI